MGRLSFRSRRPAWGARRLLLAAGLLALATLALIGALGLQPTDLLTLLPALALAAMMLTRPYLGERVIARLRTRRARRAAAAPSVPACPRSHGTVVRGGRLIAAALAGRAPPAALAGCS